MRLNSAEDLDVYWQPYKPDMRIFELTFPLRKDSVRVRFADHRVRYVQTYGGMGKASDTKATSLANSPTAMERIARRSHPSISQRTAVT